MNRTTTNAARKAKPQTRKPVDEVEAKRRELKRLTRLVEQKEFDFRLVSDMEKELASSLAELRKVSAQDPDPVSAVIAAATAIIKKWYPTAYAAELSIHCDRGDTKYIPAFRLPIPIPQPLVTLTADELKAAVKRYADRNHAGWDQASISIDKGVHAHEERERSEFLLIEAGKK